MPPRRGGCRGAVEPKGQIYCIERILEGLVQAFQDNHSNKYAKAPKELAVQVPRAEVVSRTTIKQFQQLRPLNFSKEPQSHGRKILAFRN